MSYPILILKVPPFPKSSRKPKKEGLYPHGKCLTSQEFKVQVAKKKLASKHKKKKLLELYAFCEETSYVYCSFSEIGDAWFVKRMMIVDEHIQVQIKS